MRKQSKQRELRFRVFFYDGLDYSTGKMITALEAFRENYIEFTEDGSLVPVDKCSIIIQDTGLKDKNGKGICDGDILQFPGTFKSEVLFKRGCYVLSIGAMLYEYAGDMEVVGNIYETPELLK